jgi:hypothetical protein
MIMIDIEYFVIFKYFIQSTVVGCVSFTILIWLYFYLLASKSFKNKGLNREDFYLFFARPLNIGLFLLAVIVSLMGAFFSFLFFAASLDPLFYFWHLPLNMVDSSWMNDFRTTFTLFPLLCAWLVCITQAIISLILFVFLYRYAKKNYILHEDNQSIFFVKIHHIHHIWRLIILLLLLYIAFFLTREEAILSGLSKIMPFFK